MEITGLKCNSCERRCFLEDDESIHWSTATFTVPASKTRVTVHYCPDCSTGILNKATQVSEKLDTGKRQVISPAYVDPNLQAMLTPDVAQHTANGYAVPQSSIGGPVIPAPAWNTPDGPPVGGPLQPSDASGVWDPAPTVRIGRDSSMTERAERAPRPGKRRRAAGGARGAMARAINQTSAWLPHWALAGAGMFMLALHLRAV